MDFFSSIVEGLSNPFWWASQVFAFIALIFFVWGWQIKNKILMMKLIGIASISLVISAGFLENFSLSVLFGLAAIRNFVFAYLDWRADKGRALPKKVNYIFAGVFAALTITASVLFMTVLTPYVKIHSWWLELLICVTLLGLIAGNVLEGTNLMRISFILNRTFNIINYIFFTNVIAIIVASISISSNFVFYFRQLASHLKKRKNPALAKEKTVDVLEENVE
jgi:hypothetical protein